MITPFLAALPWCINFVMWVNTPLPAWEPLWERIYPPYVMAFGAPGIPRGINAEGLKRHGFSDEQRKKIKNAYRTLYRKELPFKEAVEILTNESKTDEDIKIMAEFCQRSQNGRGIIR